MIASIILVPLLAALVLVIAGKNQYAKYIALFASLISLVLVLFANGTSSISWFSIGKISFDISVSALAINKLLMFLVLTLSPAIFLYSFDFMDMRSEQKRYYIEMLSLETVVLVFAMSSSFVTLLIAWEFLSVVSYLLVGFWYDRERAAEAARKVVTIALISDLALLASVVLFANLFGTLDFVGVISGASTTGAGGALSVAVALLVVAVIAKSSQFPFHEWLPYAMEGPAPAAAFLSSMATPKAGIFAAIVLFPIFAAANYLPILLAVGLLTAVFATFNAAREQNVKKVIAYSSVQQLALMLMAIGSGAVLVAVYFFVVQSFYNALLLLISGIMTKITKKEDLKEISGLRQNRLLYISALFGVLSVAGFIPFSGFFGSIGIGYAFSSNLIIYALISLVGMGTSFYIFRWILLCSRDADNNREKVYYETQAKGTLLSLVFLAALTLFLSPLFFILPSLLKTSNIPNGKGIALSWGIAAAAVEAVIAAVGAYISYRAYRGSSAGKKKKGRIFAEFAHSAAVFNEIYAYFTMFVYEFADGISYLDSHLNDFFDFLGISIVSFFGRIRKTAAGSFGLFMAIFIVGFLILFIALVI